MAQNLTWGQRGVLILIAGAVAIGFFWRLHVIVSPRVPRPRRPQS